MCGVWVDDQYKQWVENNKDWTLHMFGHKGTYFVHFYYNGVYQGP
jgi:hypothetical protein